MTIALSATAINHIYAARAFQLSGDAKLAVSDTQAQIGTDGTLRWQVTSPESAIYTVSVLYSAAQPVRASFLFAAHKMDIELPAPQGCFFAAASNFERVDTGIKMPLASGENIFSIAFMGQCALASLELATEEARIALTASTERARQRRVPISPFAKGYGFMFHWVAQSMPRAGEPLPYAQAVEQFDEEAFADMVAEAGGKYVFFTTNHMYPHFPAPLSEWEARFPGSTTRRDLIADIGRALDRRGIALMLYINFTSALYHNGEPFGERAAFTEFACSIFSAVGRRYGALLKGWWVDSCYQLDREFVNMDFEPLLCASREGNPERITAFNDWILPIATPFLDYWAGEVCDIIRFPDAQGYLRGCAAGVPPHALLLMEDNWWHDKQDKPIASPRFNADELADFVSGMNMRNGMVTLNLQIYQDGGIGTETMAILRKLNEKINGCLETMQ